MKVRFMRMIFRRRRRFPPLPPSALRFMNEDDERLLRTGRELVGLLFTHGLTPTGSLLDVGCGYGRLAVGLLTERRFQGRYHGFDVLKRHVAWCRETLTPVAPSYTFDHLDVRNGRYNPTGTVEPENVRFPVEDASVTTAALFSVFTHFHRADIERYLAELARVLQPGGKAVTTWLLYDEERLPLVTAGTAAYPMRHRLDEHTLCAELEDPLRAIAFEESVARGWVTAAGLEISDAQRGSWAGEPGPVFQDLLVLRRPAGDGADGEG